MVRTQKEIEAINAAGRAYMDSRTNLEDYKNRANRAIEDSQYIRDGRTNQARTQNTQALQEEASKWYRSAQSDQDRLDITNIFGGLRQAQAVIDYQQDNRKAMDDKLQEAMDARAEYREAERNAKEQARLYALYQKHKDDSLDDIFDRWGDHGQDEEGNFLESYAPALLELTGATAQEKAEAARRAYERFTDIDSHDNGYNFDHTDIAYDAKLTALKGNMDYWEQQARNERNQGVTDANVKAIQAMPQEAQDLLKIASQRIDDTAYDNRAQFEAREAAKTRLQTEFGLDKKTMKRYLETLQRTQDQADMTQEVGQAQNMVNSGPLGAAIANLQGFGDRFVGGGAATMGTIGQLFTRTGQYEGFNPYDKSYQAQARGQTVVQETANLLGPKGGTVYQAATSAVDSAIRLGVGMATGGALAEMGLLGAGMTAAKVGGNISLGLAGAGSFGSTAQESAAQNRTVGQTLLLSTADAAAEILTEKISLDNLLKGIGDKNVLLTILKQGAVEPSEELMSMILGIGAQALILQGGSDWNQMVGELVASGVPGEQAQKMAWDNLVQEAKTTILVSALSGMMSAGGGAVVGKAQELSNPNLIADGNLTEEAPVAAKKPREARSGENQAQAQADITDLFGAQEQTAQVQENITQEAEPTLADRARELYDQRNEKTGQISNSQAAEILQDPDMVEYLELQTGLDLESDDPSNPYRVTAERRRKVKQAFDMLFDADWRQKYPDWSAGKDLKDTILAMYQNRPAGSGNITLAQANEILNNPELLDYLKDQTGAKIAGNSQKRKAAVVQAVSDLVDGKTTDKAYQRKGVSASIPSGITPDITDIFGATQQNGGQPVGTNEGQAIPASAAQNRADAKDTSNPAANNGQVTANDIQETRNEPVGGTEPAAQPVRARFSVDRNGNVVDSQESGGVKESKVGTNSYRNANDPETRAAGRDVRKNAPELNQYQAQTEAGQNAEAEARTNSPEKIRSEAAYLAQKTDPFTGADVKTANKVIHDLFKQGDLAGSRAVYKALRAQMTNAGQAIQAMAELSRRDPAQIANRAMDVLESMTARDVDKKYLKGKTLEQFQTEAQTAIADIASRMDSIQEGDARGMHDIIRQIASIRQTTDGMSLSKDVGKRTARLINALDYEISKEVAMRQLESLPLDFRHRSIGEKAQTLWVNNVLASLKSVNRNFGGNGVQAFADTISGTTGGQLLDKLVGSQTGLHVAGNELTHMGDFVRAGRMAWNFATLCIDLDIPMDSPGKYDFSGKGGTNTFQANGNLMDKFFHFYGNAMNYALNATDAIFVEGGKAQVIASLRALGEGSGLSEADIEAIGDLEGARRTYKDERRLSKGAKGLQKTLNQMVGSKDGSRGLGTLISPFAGVPSNVAQTAIDYTPVGVGEGIAEAVSVIKDAKRMGGNMTAEQKTELAVRQRKAVSDFGRGLTGSGLLFLAMTAAKAGILSLREPKDKDQENADQNRYISGVTLNLSALGRYAQGGDPSLKDGDVILGTEALDQFEVMFTLAAVWAQNDKTFAQKGGESFTGVYNAIADSPMMQGISGLQDLASDSVAAVQAMGNLSSDDPDAVEEAQKELATAAGNQISNVTSGFLPAFVRNTAQAMDTTIRDTSDPNPWRAALNREIAAKPGLSRTLPAKYDPLTGQAQKRDSGTIEAIANRVFLPSSIHRYQENAITSELDALAKATGNTSIYPAGKAPKQVRVGSEVIELTGADKELYQRTLGEKNAKRLGELLEDPNYQRLDAEDRTELIREAEKEAKAQAVAAVYGYQGFSEAAKGEMLRLSQENSGILWEPPKNKVSYTDRVGDKQTAKLEGEQYETYKSKSREEASKLLEGLAGNEAYKALAPDDQAAAVKYAYQYADLKGKQAAIPDLWTDPSDWREKLSGDVVSGIVAKVGGERVDHAVNAMTGAWEHGFDSSQEREDLAAALADFGKLPSSTKGAILSGADGTTKKALEASEAGVDPGTITDIFRGQTHFETQKSDDEIGRLQTVVSARESGRLTADQETAMLKSEMPKYKDGTNYDQPRLDAVIGGGYSGGDYVWMRSTWKEISGGKTSKAKRKQAKEAFMEHFGMSDEEAERYVELFSGFKASELGQDILAQLYGG